MTTAVLLLTLLAVEPASKTEAKHDSIAVGHRLDVHTQPADQHPEFGGDLSSAMIEQGWLSLYDGNTTFGSLPVSLVLPQGRKGPAFIAYPNFNIYLEWNQSFIYTTSAAYFATRLTGAEPYTKGNPEAGLSVDEMKALQTRLQAHGHDVGKIDGILGSGTRVAVQKEQQKLGMPADGWATPALLNAL